MMHHARIERTLLGSALVIMLGATGCLGDASGTDPSVPGDPLEQDGIICEASLLVTTGTFTPEGTPPEGVGGCWAVGLWEFSMEVVENGCDEPLVLEPQYRYQVGTDADLNYTYTYLVAPDDPNVEMKVSGGGSGLCEGSFAHYINDGYGVLTLKPNQHADGTIDGQGDYELYKKPQL